ncbi:MAG: type II toxin-antitoxin system RelE/ParE family toxin, partial [Verrucomicrobiota bacterium]
MRLIHHPDAETELIEAAQFYERRVPTLGARFLDAADCAVRAIQEAPERWSIIEADVRHFLMPRFPYAIYYRVLPDHLRILA